MKEKIEIELNKEAIELQKDGKTIVIKNLLIENEEIHKFFRETEENKRIVALKSSIKIGITGLKRMNVGTEMDFIEKEFNDMNVKITQMFDPDNGNSHISKLISLLKDYFDKGGTLETLIDPAQERSPINKLKLEIQREFKELRELFIKKETEEKVINKTPLKGLKFEDICEQILGDYVSTDIGDIVVRTTNECGYLTGSFAGDFVIRLNGIIKNEIVIEVRDWNSISQPQIIQSLKQAMKNRNASYGLFVSKYKEALPKHIGWYKQLDGNMSICALGSKKNGIIFPQLLHLILQFTKIKLQREMGIGENERVSIVQGIENLVEKMDKFTQIKIQCKNINRASEQIQLLSSNLKEDIANQVKKIQKAIFSVFQGE